MTGSCLSVRAACEQGQRGHQQKKVGRGLHRAAVLDLPVSAWGCGSLRCGAVVAFLLWHLIAGTSSVHSVRLWGSWPKMASDLAEGPCWVPEMPRCVRVSQVCPTRAGEGEGRADFRVTCSGLLCHLRSRGNMRVVRERPTSFPRPLAVL